MNKNRLVRMMSPFVFSFAVLFLLTGQVSAASRVELIDVPTCETVGHGACDVNFRVYEQGCVKTRLLYGIMPKLDLGVVWGMDNLIGRGGITVQIPDIYIKFMALELKEVYPGFAIGFDGQGWDVSDPTSTKYEPDIGKGFFFVISHNLRPNMVGLHAGINARSNFRDFQPGRDLFGFLGMHYNPDEQNFFFLEWDNIHDMQDSRLNLGYRYWVIPEVALELSLMNMGGGPNFNRILRFTYSSAF